MMDMSAMREMMREMLGVQAPKEFYPALMDLPALSPEQRQSLESQARSRISLGMDEIAKAESALRHALAARDVTAGDVAARQLREGLNHVASGTAILRALAEGKAPQQIALDWFRTQLSLAPPQPALFGASALGLSWIHLITMAFVSALAAAMLAVSILRTRRAHVLVNRLTAGVPATLAVSKPRPAPAPSQQSSGPAAKTDIAVPLQQVSSVRPTSWTGQLRVAAIFCEAPNVKTFRLRHPGGEPIPFTFLPGQFLTFAANIDGSLVRRSYTIASSASQSAFVECTVKREDAGVFSEYLHDRIVVGSILDVSGPWGSFTFRGSEAESVVLIGGGVGITPLMASIRYLTDTAWPGEIFLIYAARTPGDFIFHDELEYLQRQHPNLRVVATIERTAGTSWMGRQGLISKEFLSQAVPDLSKRRIHLCGPPGMMIAVRECLKELGVPEREIKTEAFGPARGAVPPPSHGTGLPPEALTAQDLNLAPATARIHFAQSGKTAPLSPDQTVLEAAESIGVHIDYACRAGVCGTCKTKLLEGKVSMEVEDALTAGDKANNYILACQAKSIGNLTVEA
jgi:ferredoxin-NADP reductase